jgi:hypothetical protein
MTNSIKTLFQVAAALVVTFASAPANADTISIQLAAPFQQTGVGQTLIFDATLTNTSGATVYLNSDSASLAGPLFLDDGPFFTNFPLSLDPGDSFTGELFDVVVPTGPSSLGLYAGTFSIIGGDPSDFTDVIASADFNVFVTPEPASIVLLSSGIAALLVVMYTSRIRTAQ